MRGRSKRLGWHSRFTCKFIPDPDGCLVGGQFMGQAEQEKTICGKGRICEGGTYRAQVFGSEVSD